jgi:hypothetical protein
MLYLEGPSGRITFPARDPWNADLSYSSVYAQTGHYVILETTGFHSHRSLSDVRRSACLSTALSGPPGYLRGARARRADELSLISAMSAASQYPCDA